MSTQQIDKIELSGGSTDIYIDSIAERIVAAISMLLIGHIYGKIGTSVFTNVTIHTEISNMKIDGIDKND